MNVLRQIDPRVAIPIFLICYEVVWVGYYAAKNGQPWQGRYNFFRASAFLVAKLAVLFAAGFFSLDKNLWPQAIYLLIRLVALGSVVAKHGQRLDSDSSPTINGWASFWLTVFDLLILCWGGLFDPLLYR